MTNEFSVYWWDPEGNYHRERQWVGLEDAIWFAKSFTTRPAARAGFVTKVIVTDGGDCCIWEWQYGKGLTWPTPDMLREDIRKLVN
jgi:hypothetical protein